MRTKELWRVSVSVGRSSTIVFTTYNVIANEASAACGKAIGWAEGRGHKAVRALKCEYVGPVIP